MKRFLITLCSILIAIKGSSQKKPLDTAILEKFPVLSYPTCKISDDGKFVSYSFYQPDQDKQIMTVQSTNANWKVDFPNAQAIAFTKNGQQFVFLNQDTLSLLSLSNKKIHQIVDVESYSQPTALKQEWLAYRLKKEKKKLVLLNLLTNKETSFDNIKDFYFDEDGEVLILHFAKKGTDLDSLLLWRDLKNGIDNNVLRISEPSGMIMRGEFDNDNSQFTFLWQHGSGSQAQNTIWHYKKGMQEAEVIIDERYSKLPMAVASSPPFFSGNGKHILFRLKEPSQTEPMTNDGVMVNVWSYKDSIIQTAQINNFAGHITQTSADYLFASFTADSEKITRIEGANEKMSESGNNGCFVVQTVNPRVDHWWNTLIREKVWLICLGDTSEKKTLINTPSFQSPMFSPNGRYLVFYDREKAAYFSMDVFSDQIVNISDGINKPLSRAGNTEGVGSPHHPAGIAGWIEDGISILVYDRYDIWLLDVTGDNSPFNVTNAYGDRHKIIFRLIEDDKAQKYGISFREDLFLSAFGIAKKFDGFYQQGLGAFKDPQLLIFEPATWSHAKTLNGFGIQEQSINSGMNPIKANASKAWIAAKQTPSSAPNLFFSKNLKSFKALTDMQPHRTYNWYTAELINFKKGDSSVEQGIFYKPESFDSSKKYPVIIYYYERMSPTVYNYLFPSYANGSIDVPYFVSNEYLVFATDITYAAGRPGKSAYSSVVAAAAYVSQLKYVDSTRLGITGASFGGFETNYIITHTNIFAAAAEGCGVSDLISFYGVLGGRPGREHESNQKKVEWGQYRMGSTLWENPDAYIDNSPIFNLHKVTTPLLMMHNRSDDQVSWYQGIELFAGLRRLRKKVWMLEYDKGTHGIRGKDAMDYTIRLKQFFDYYLKNAPPPKWMTLGIPASKKGINKRGLEYDNPSVIP